jgi:hypothetical protein
VREIWDAGNIRQFNLGIAKASESPVHGFAIEPETIKTVAANEARIAVTIDPPYPEEAWEKQTS